MLRGEHLRDFDELASQNDGMTNAHIKHITKGLLRYFFPISALSKQKHAMRKPRRISFKHFSTRLMEMNNFLPLFPGLEASKKMSSKELNKILLHAIPNSWVK